jgi:hypothetical protein
MSIYISSSALSPPEILQFIQLIDSARCLIASISSEGLNRDWLEIAAKSCSLKLTSVSMRHLQTLDINNRHFSPRQWSNLLRHLEGPQVETIRIRGQPSAGSLNKFLSRHSHIRMLAFKPHWAQHNKCIKASESLPKYWMSMLAEIEGPPCHMRVVLGFILPTSPALTIRMNYDCSMTYRQYVHAVLCAVSRCKSPVHLDIILASHADMFLDKKELESLCIIPLPEVRSVEISFFSISEGQVIVCVSLLNSYSFS